MAKIPPVEAKKETSQEVGKVKVRFHTAKDEFKSGRVYNIPEYLLPVYRSCCTLVPEKEKGGK